MDRIDAHLLFRTEPTADRSTFAIQAVAADGTPFLAVFAGAQAADARARLKPQLDAMWTAREEDSWMGEAPAPSPDEEALPIALTGVWRQSTHQDDEGCEYAHTELAVHGAQWRAADGTPLTLAQETPHA